MKIGYLDCFAGCAGDMFLGALLDAGVDRSVLDKATAALGVGASLRVETVDRSGISCTKVHVMEGDRLADAPSVPVQEQGTSPGAGVSHSHQPQTQHLHKGGHAHTHTAGEETHVSEARHGAPLGDGEHSPEHGEHSHEHGQHSHEHEHAGHEHPHVHGRSLTEITRIINGASLDDEVKRMALKAFGLLGASEAKIHNVPVDDIHFHEVGAVDAIVDIVASCAGLHALGVGKWYCSPVNVGGGMVVCAHGTFPVPAPATADLLRGVPTYSAHVQKELVTPTGAALLRMLEPTFGAQPAMAVDAIGYGAGTRNPKDFPNVLRLSIGEDAAAGESVTVLTQSAGQEASVADASVTVLETALDDLSPQVLAYVAERLLAEGALDVMLSAVVMKKGRPGTLMTVLCNAADKEKLTALLLRETSTLGVRSRTEQRACLDREQISVQTEFGAVRVKVGSEQGEVRNAAPEFEDCRAAAEAHGVPLKQVQQAALRAYAAVG